MVFCLLVVFVFYKVVVMLLIKKDGLLEKVIEIFNELCFDFNCQYDEKDFLGKCYCCQDVIGMLFCIMVDYQMLEDQMVMVCDCDIMKQDCVVILELNWIIVG